jgi:hypothetical protein
MFESRVIRTRFVAFIPGILHVAGVQCSYKEKGGCQGLLP